MVFNRIMESHKPILFKKEVFSREMELLHEGYHGYSKKFINRINISMEMFNIRQHLAYKYGQNQYGTVS